MLAQTEDYVEYSRSGKIIKGQEKEIIRSKYEEDVLINNHTSVWGSFWKGGQWGYKCCYSFIKNSYCLGEAGKNQVSVPEVKIVEEEKRETSAESDGEINEKVDAKKLKKKDKKRKQKERVKQKKKEVEVDKLEEALKREEAAQKEAEGLLAMNERKRPYNSMIEVKKPTEEEIEAYYLKRKREDDPMKDFL